MKQPLLYALLCVCIYLGKPGMPWFNCIVYEHSAAGEPGKMIATSWTPSLFIQPDIIMIGDSMRLDIGASSSGYTIKGTDTLIDNVYKGAIGGKRVTARLECLHDSSYSFRITYSQPRDSVNLFYLIRRQ
jgi:hypothetical protein